MNTVRGLLVIAGVLVLGAVHAPQAQELSRDVEIRSDIDIERDTGTRTELESESRINVNRDGDSYSRTQEESVRRTREIDRDPVLRVREPDTDVIRSSDVRVERRSEIVDDDFDRTETRRETRQRSYQFYTRDHDSYDWYDNVDRWDRDSDWYWEYRTRDGVDLKGDDFWLRVD